MVKKRLSAIFCCGAILLASASGCSTAKNVPANAKSKGLYSGYEDYKYYKKGKSLSGSIINLGNTPVTSYDGYLGYGYDVVNSDYFNSKDINVSSPVLDINKMAADKLIYSRPVSATSIDTITGSSSESFLKKLTAKTSISASGLLFKASFSASFSSSSDKSSKDSYIKTIMAIGEKRDYVLLSDISLDDLKKYRTAAFKNAVNTANIETLFKTYGTHVLLDVAMGGRMDLNYTFHNENSLSEEDISVRASEVYRSVKAKESVSLSENAKSFLDNSTFSAEQFGGTTDDNISTLADAQDAYGTWSSSLENSKKLDFIGAPDPKNPAAFIPIWELADSTGRQTELEKYYDKMVSDKEIADDNANKQTVYYVKDIYFGEANKHHKDDAMSNLTANIQNADSNAQNVKITDFDLNDSTKGGDYLYMGYTLTTDKSKAITNLMVDNSSDNNLPGTEEYKGVTYSVIDQDINNHAGGDYIKLYCTRDPNAGNPLTALGIQFCDKNEGKSFSGDLKGWTTVNKFSSNDKLDLNRGIHGSTTIYMWQQRSPDGSNN